LDRMGWEMELELTNLVLRSRAQRGVSKDGHTRCGP
jgi:hypothetical protein